jgi:hypothetical protein
MGLQEQSTPTSHVAQQQHGILRFQQSAWIGLTQQEWRWWWRRRWLPTVGVSTARNTGQHMDYTPTLYKRFKNWNYCHTHSGNINNRHTSRRCTKPGPAHNPHARRTNMMNGLPTGLHKMILSSASGCSPQVPRQQRPPAPATWQQPPPPVNFTTPMPQMMRPAPYHQMH